MTFVLTNFWPLLLCRFLVGAAHMTISHLPYMLGKYWAKKIGVAQSSHFITFTLNNFGENPVLSGYIWMSRLATFV